jgi:epoxyqueuosine reductase
MLTYRQIHEYASEVGFDLCGIAPCNRLEQQESFFRHWLADGRHASLEYLERNIEKRFDVRQLVEGATTLVVCAINYKNSWSCGYPDSTLPKIASYALNRDYHLTLKERLSQLFQRLKADAPTLSGRAFVDSAPLSEKQWAVQAGLGWIGRQSLLVTPQYGTFVVLGELVVNLPCDRYDVPLQGYGCGACRRCIDTCPNHAIGEDRAIDARRCISCRTIERGASQEVALHGWIFGCDACQSCCPHNRLTPQHGASCFDPVLSPGEYPATRWLGLSEQEFRDTFAATPLSRSGLSHIQANVMQYLAEQHHASSSSDEA